MSWITSFRPIGDRVGEIEGEAVGVEVVGETVGDVVGTEDVGPEVGDVVGVMVGFAVGLSVKTHESHNTGQASRNPLPGKQDAASFPRYCRQ